MAKKTSKDAEAKSGGMERDKAGRVSWFDDSQKPLIDQYAQEMDSFVQTVADGKVSDTELKAQEVRLVGLMKELEPLLDDALHEKVTRLLCEMAAYDFMQMLHQVQQNRPRTQFKG